jgi:hypothetical protein
MKNLLVLAMALLFLIPFARTAFAAPAREMIPNMATKAPVNMTRLSFKGTAQSNETAVTVFPTMSVTASGSGNATQLGQFTITYEVEMNLMDLSTIESARFVGTNGDTLSAEAIGQATENRTPGMLNLVEIYRITGGTGRFAGASGTITLNRLVSVTTGVAASTFEGYVLIPWN